MRIGMKRTMYAALVVAALAFPTFASAQLPTERLYKGVAPGSESWKFPEVERTSPNGGASVSNVRDPTITAYLPDPAKANGAAVVHLPGGALRFLGIGQEAQEIIKRFNDRGVAVIVLKYRTIQADPNAPRGGGAPGSGAPPAGAPRAGGPPPAGGGGGFNQKLDMSKANANPARGDAQLTNVLKLATADAVEAMRRVRSHAKEWRIDPNKVGMIGSSAGGGVAFGALLAGDPAGAPNFIISLYGPSLQDVTVPANAPPLFMATETPHGAVTDGLLALFTLWKDAGKPVELHIYDVPNFAMPASMWADRAFDWMTEQKILPAAAK